MRFLDTRLAFTPGYLHEDARHEEAHGPQAAIDCDPVHQEAQDLRPVGEVLPS